MEQSKKPSKTRKAIISSIAMNFTISSMALPPSAIFLSPSRAFAQSNEEIDGLFDDEEFEEPIGNFSDAPPAPPATPPDFGSALPSGPSEPSFGGNDDRGNDRFNRGSGNGRGGSTAGGASQLPTTPTSPSQTKSRGAPPLADAQIEDMTDENYPDLMEANFPNAEITDVVRNLGISPQDRALNYSATNALLVAQVFKDAIRENLVLGKYEVERSPVCRPESDCWDVKLTFFNPSKIFEQASKVYLFTVDVGDVVPVMVGKVRSWFVYVRP